MANILKVTTPVGGYDNTNHVRVNPEMQNPVHVQGAVNTEKVVRPDARSDSASQENKETLQFKYETNFDNFIRQLKNSPVLTQELSKLFKEYQALLAEPGSGKEFIREAAQFLSMIEIDAGYIQGFIKDQSMSAVRYTGSFFEVLRHIMNQTESVELKNSILNFLKRYTDMAESPFILKDIQRSIKEILQRMYPQQRSQAEQMEKGLKYGADAAQNVSENLKTLKSALLPFLNSYISDTHDRGILRDMTAHLAELTARYENGQQDGVLQAFEKLRDFQVFQKHFQNFDNTKLFEILANTEFERASRRNKKMDRLTELICRGALGEAGTENTQAFRELLRSLLLNESVYMPVLHLLLPMQAEGRLMFSEMWIDPDAQGGEQRGKETKERLVKGLVKFDIQDVGFFDLFFLYNDEKITLQLNLPDSLRSNTEKIEDDIRRILKEHSLETEEFLLGSSRVSIPLTEAFPNLKERKNSINVSI